MTRLRAMTTILIALSLVVVPASVGASAASMASIAAAVAPECGAPCSMVDQVDAKAGMPMSGDCQGTGGKGAPMSPSACTAFCSGFLALPTCNFVVVRKVSGNLLSPDVRAKLAARIDPPEPPPPKS
jgi:hypothetical protein